MSGILKNTMALVVATLVLLGALQGCNGTSLLIDRII
jgi:hypothetical protein